VRVGIVGLGDIAQKAWLPVLLAQDGVEPVLVTRDERRRAELLSRHRVREGHRSVEQALERGLDAAFVHTATVAHREVVTALLRAGVPTCVDKPLDTSGQGAAELVQLADAGRTSLLVAFNRRWAPAYRDVAAWADRDVVLLQKHRAGSPDEVRRVVFDDFIHVVDTLRFLLDGLDGRGGSSGDSSGDSTDTVSVTARGDRDGLRRVALQLTRGQRIAVGVMHRTAGLTEEVLEVVADGRRRRVVDLADVTDAVGASCTTRRDEWVPVGVQRGFAALAEHFLTSVRSGQVLDASDALATHRLCEQVVREVEALLDLRA
jgi:virulence factor